MAIIPRIIVTPGEPAGIGPDIVLQLAQKPWLAELAVICDPDLLLARSKQLHLNITLSELSLTHHPEPHQPQQLKVIPVKLAANCEPGKLNKANAGYVIECLQLATDMCLTKKAHALVTGPVQKSILNEAGIAFSGHTEFLAERCKSSQVLMLFVVNQLKIALVTTHLPLRDVPQALTREKIINTIKLLHASLIKQFGLVKPVILVAGLNPHAGEQGHLGREEIDIIEPALKELQQNNIDVKGPLPADTLFTEKYLKNSDAIVAMYHDQALPIVKYLGFDHAVNVTLGLPIIRTSVDHGTALDIAGTLQANPGSLEAATTLAIKLLK